MTIDATTAWVAYTGNGATTNFAVPFLFWDSAEVRVIRRTIATGVELELVLDTDYTLSGTGTDSETITTLTTYSNAYQIIITRAQQFLQESDYVDGDPLTAATLEASLDRAIAHSQQLKTLADRSLHIPITDAAARTTEIPNSVDRATRIFGFDANGDPTVSTTATITGIDTVVADAQAQAAAAAASAAAALVSENNAAASETNAATSETNAATSASNAATSETNAATSASNAAAAVDDAELAGGLLRYAFSTTTGMADPGSGVLRLNHATVASATAMAVSAVTGGTGTPNVQAFLLVLDNINNALARSVLTIRSVNTPGAFAVFYVTAATDNTTWAQLTVTYVTGSGAFGNTDPVTCFVTLSGADGAGDASTSGTLAQFAATTSAQLAGVISDETGSGALVFATSPTLVTPALGTPTSGNLSNCTAYPAATTTTSGIVEKSTSAENLAGVSDTVYPTVAGVTEMLGTVNVPVNLIINGDFSVNQRQTTTGADDTYILDRWYTLRQSNNVTVAQQTLQEDGQATNLRLTQSNAVAQRMGVAQIVEAANSQPLRGENVVLSARIRSSSGNAVRYAILEWTSTADSVTSDVVNDWTSGTYTSGNFFIASNPAVLATGSTTPTAATWTSVSLTATLTSSCNNIIVFFWTSSAEAQNVTLDIGSVCFSKGTAAGEFPIRSNELERLLCYRYYQKSYAEATAPGTATTVNELVGREVFGSTTTKDQLRAQLYPPMRTSPTITWYSPATGASANYRNSTTSTDVAVSSTAYTSTKFTGLLSRGASGDALADFLIVHYTADAEL